MATFDGYDLGFVFEMNTAPAPVALQVNAYPGINGVGVINHGSRGGRTTLLAALIGDDETSLTTFTQTLRSLAANAVKSTLIDQEGTVWESVRMVAFEPFGPRVRVAGGGIARQYRADFFHSF